MFKVNPKRTFVIPYNNEKEGISFTATFRFLYSEEQDLSAVRKKMGSLDEGVADKKPEELSPEEEVQVTNIFMYILRTSLIDCTDIFDNDGNELKPNTEENQKAIFEAIKSVPDIETETGAISYMRLIMDAYNGESLGN